MKVPLILLALLVVAPPAIAQNIDSQSDSYVCYHGQANDPGTDAACAKVQSAAAARPTKPPPIAPPPSSPSTAANETTLTEPPSATAPAPHGAASAPADVGEAPVAAAAENADEDANADQRGDDENVNVHGSWFAGLGALAIVFGAIIALGALAIYFIPTMIAVARRKRSALGIFALNLFLGWSFIGWIAALVWSLTSEYPPRR